MAFPTLGNSDNVVSVSFEFQSNSKWDAPFHHIAYDNSCADCDSLCDHLRDIPWDDIFKLSASAAAASEFYEWVQVGIGLAIYLSSKESRQVSLISIVSSCLCCCHSS